MSKLKKIMWQEFFSEINQHVDLDKAILGGKKLTNRKCLGVADVSADPFSITTMASFETYYS